MATDKLFYMLAKSYPAAILKLLNIPDAAAYRASSFTFKEIENRRDIIFEKVSGAEVVLLETQGYDDTYFYHNTLIGAMLYCAQNKFTGTFHIAVLFLDESHRLAASRLAHHFDGKCGVTFAPSVFVLRQKGVSELEAFDDVHLIPLYPLCDVTSEHIKAYAPNWAEHIKADRSLTEKQKNDLLALLGGFIAHRVRNLTLKDIDQFLGDFKMEETQVGKDLIAIGLAKGHAEGHAEGIAEGIAEGLEEGKAFGALKTQREDVIDLLTAKWGMPEKRVLDRIDDISSVTMLKSLFKALLRARTRKQMESTLKTLFEDGVSQN